MSEKREWRVRHEDAPVNYAHLIWFNTREEALTALADWRRQQPTATYILESRIVGEWIVDSEVDDGEKA